MPDFSVAGGGIAGLVVARRLALSGADVVLHEASDRLGGTVARHVVGGIELDAGAESFAVRGGSVAALLAELGMAGDIVAPRPGPAWLQPASGPAVPLPATSLLGIPGDPLADDVVAVVGREAAERAAALDARPLGELAGTLGALVRDRLGDDLLDVLVTPVVRGVHSIHPDELPLERAHPGLRDALAAHGALTAAVRELRAAAPPGSAVAGIRGGMHRLVARLADELARLDVDVRLGSRVDRLEGLEGTPVAAAPGLAAAEQGRRVVLMTLVVEQDDLDTAPRGSGLLVADGAPGVRARALTHATAKWDWLRESAGGRHVVRLSYDDDRRRPHDALGLIETTRQDAAALLGVDLPRDRVVDAARVVWTRPAPAGPAGDTILVGETVAGSGLAGVVAHAERVAADLLSP